MSESMLSYLISPFRTRPSQAAREPTTPTSQAPQAENDSSLLSPLDNDLIDVEMNAFHNLTNPFRQSTPDATNPVFYSVFETSSVYSNCPTTKTFALLFLVF